MGFEFPELHKRTWANLIGRLCQLVGAIVVCAYYGRILNRAMKEDVYSDSKWVYAVTVGAISGLTAFAYIVWGLLLEFRAIALLFAWDAVIVILWLVCSGIFGKMYLGENAEMDQGIQDMKIAAGFDLANMLLWIISASYCGWIIFVADRKLLSEGRAKPRPKEERAGGLEEQQL
ncbi:uncharacterized protein HMPREF1541_04477 [Cyphellophora europaea CBS 101466]|uniref:MARVEL domain-containing protein n=1 Tax=Cyphellophora europaea (strain CBS 101466) TaxID=1220924 RepID=W2RUJ7_CYPE1|nr:uncharacterized protein HMPREF1541_04477 [Cyphellophora europaea CBS 101466]ETN40201.1 hypothetical protein HMPREF1541_04477 [Cyphellophora europaea CBS 101466]